MSKQDELLDEIVQFAEDGNWEEFDNAVGELRELITRPTPQADEKRLEVPEGYALVPIEPTDEMITAGFVAGNDYATQGYEYYSGGEDEIYKAMLNAAPQTEPKDTD